MLRAWANPWADGAERIWLEPDEAHHLGRVRRARDGQAVQVLDGRGRVADGVWQGFDGRGGWVNVTASRTVERPPQAVSLAVAPPKGGAWGTILEQAVELGVTAVVPLVTDRVEVRLEPGERRHRWHEKARATLREAAKQSGNPWLPELAEWTPWDLWVNAPLAEGERRLWACLEPGVPSLAKVRAANPKVTSWSVGIGPEGDFSSAEAALARVAGLAPFSLGSNVLRTETAAVVTVAQLVV